MEVIHYYITPGYYITVVSRELVYEMFTIFVHSNKQQTHISFSLPTVIHI